MELKEIFKKVVSEEALTKEEKDFLASWEEGRIPKSRLDEEITKRKEAESKSGDLSARVEELSLQLDELKSAGMSEAEKQKADFSKQLAKLQKDLGEMTKSRDESAKALEEMKFSKAVGELATKFGFVDSSYLGYLLKNGNVSVEDEDGVSAFVKGLSTTSPHLFGATAKAGSGTIGEAGATVGSSKARLEELSGKSTLTNKELAEMIELSESLKTSNKE